MEQLDALTPGSDLDALLEWIQDHGGERDVCLVGHAPDVSLITGDLIGQSDIDEMHLRFAKGAVAAVEDPSNFRDQIGQLHWLITAKMLGV